MGDSVMGLKKDLTTLTNFSNNPHEATYRPEKEMKRLYVGLLLTLPIFLGFCCEFYILASGPIFIYWIVTYFNGREYWKDLGWKMRWYYLPMIPMALIGILFAFNHTLVNLGGMLFRFIGFK